MTTGEPLAFGLVGYGEVGGILGAALAKTGRARVAAWDLLLALSRSTGICTTNRPSRITC